MRPGRPLLGRDVQIVIIRNQVARTVAERDALIERHPRGVVTTRGTSPNSEVTTL